MSSHTSAQRVLVDAIELSFLARIGDYDTAEAAAREVLELIPLPYLHWFAPTT